MRLFLCILSCSLPSFTLGKEPGVAALDFLEKVRKGELNLEPGGDTSLQPNTADAKKDAIREGIRRLGTDLREGDLEIGAIREDVGFAAVMIRKAASFDSSEMGVYPVALVKSGDEWRPAPVLASFENAVEGYTLPISARLGRLEEWMMKERVADLGRLIAESSERTRERISKSLMIGDLEGNDLAKITDLFLKKCMERDRAALLGFLGGLGKTLPDDWSARLAASRAAVDGKGAWRLLVAPEIVRLPVHYEMSADRTGMVSIACLDPDHMTEKRRGMIRMLHIEARRDESGVWSFDLPAVLMTGDDFSDDDADLDADLAGRFPKKLRELNPLVRDDTARDALDGVMASLKSPSLRVLLGRADIGSSKGEGMNACLSAAGLWWSLNKPGTLRLPLELGFKEEGNVAVAAFQWFSVNDADVFEPVMLFFRKSEKGWAWTPGISAPDGNKALEWWLSVNKPGWTFSWRKELVKTGVPLEKIGFESAASDADVGGLFADWVAALGQKDLRTAFSLSAWLGGADEIPLKALRNLSHDLSNYRVGGWELAGVLRSESWVVASVRQTTEGEKSRDAFVPIIMTAAGARILPEIELIADDGRTRDFLNEASFDRLEKFAGKEKAGELRILFDQFKKGLTKVK